MKAILVHGFEFLSIDYPNKIPQDLLVISVSELNFYCLNTIYAFQIE